MENNLVPPVPDPRGNSRKRLSGWEAIYEAVLLLVFSVVFLLYGLTPALGGDGLGLVGADEPRYAQVAREMLGRFNDAHTLKDRLNACVTPYLYGHPWLEKPVLYYWRAMFMYKDFGVHDWSARLPSTSFTFIMIGLIYLHMRRYRCGAHLEAAIITVSCAGIIGFSRGASTDMQIAAPLTIGMLGWYAWYETGSRFWLYTVYFFTGLATLAKGPVAPFLLLVVLGAFAFLRRDWSVLRRSLKWPGVALYFTVVLPWYIAVQHQNPTYSREFFLEQNLERFMTNRYQHTQPFWYYLVVLLLLTMPWTVIAMRALVDGMQAILVQCRERFSRHSEPCPARTGNAFREFLTLWALIPILFFSISKSMLPGYILPSIPAITILAGDYLFRHRQAGLNRWILIGHAFLCGITTMSVLLLPWFIVHGAQMPPLPALSIAMLAAAGVGLVIFVGVERFGVARLELITAGVMIALVVSLFGVGPLFGIPGIKTTKKVIHLLDRSYSARPLAERLVAVAPSNETVAVFRVRRDIQYGLSYYRNREVVNYEESGVPEGQHLLVARVWGSRGVDLHTTAAIDQYLQGRRHQELFSWPEQGLAVYLVAARE